jgi:hypothetical protein
MVVTVIVALPVVSTAPSMAEGTASIEPAGVAEKAPTARPEAWSLGHMVGQETAAHLEVERGWGSDIRACGDGLVMVAVEAGMGVSDAGCDAAADIGDAAAAVGGVSDVVAAVVVEIF